MNKLFTTYICKISLFSVVLPLLSTNPSAAESDFEWKTLRGNLPPYGYFQISLTAQERNGDMVGAITRLALSESKYSTSHVIVDCSIWSVTFGENDAYYWQPPANGWWSEKEFEEGSRFRWDKLARRWGFLSSQHMLEQRDLLITDLIQLLCFD